MAMIRVLKITGYWLLRLIAVGLGLVALVYICALGFRPDLHKIPPAPPPEDVTKVIEARKLELHKSNPPRITQDVDYAEGAKAAWWPKGEAPVLRELVQEGKLPPVIDRVGPEPMVMKGVDGIGRYGGAWQRLAPSDYDVYLINWRYSYTNMVRWSPEGYPLVPHLAKSWEISPDYRVFTFHLRRGMRWSDGVPVTADDFTYWYEQEVKYFNAQPFVLRNGSGLGRVEKVDDYTVRFIFQEPYALFLERLATVNTIGVPDYGEYCVPAHYLRQFHPKFGDQELIKKMLGQYKLPSALALYWRLKDWRNAEQPRLWPWILRTPTLSAPFVFVRNPYYAAVDPEGNQLPYLDRLVMQVRAQNLFGLTSAAGQVSMQERYIDYSDHVLLMSEARRNGYEVYHWYPGDRSTFTIFPVINRRVDPTQPATGWKQRLLNDRRFRQALSLALNRQDIIDALFNGQGEPAQIDPGPQSQFYSEKLLKSYTAFDPKRANVLLDELGLTGRDRDGYRTFPDGSRMVWYLSMSETTNNDPAQFVVDDWGKVGIHCIIRIGGRLLFTLERGAFLQDFTVYHGESEFTPLVEPRNFVPTYGEAFYAPAFGLWYLYGGMYGDPHARVPRSIEPPPGHPLRKNMEILMQIYRTPDAAKRAALFRQIQETNAEEVWTISIGTPPPQLVVVKNGFRNVPRIAVYSGSVSSPGNAGLETYFWDKTDDLPGARDDLKRAMIASASGPAGGAENVARSGNADRGNVYAQVGRWIFWLLAGTGLVALALALLRHPFVWHRLLLMVPTLAVISVVVFTIVQLPPGDFVTTRAMELEMEGTPSAEQQLRDLRAMFHLDEPVATRYLRWVGLRWFTSFEAKDTGLLQGNLGLSMEHNRSVNEVVGDRIVLTVAVSLATVIFTWLLAVPIGIYSAVRQYSPADYGLTLLGFFGMSVPGFLLAIVLMYLAHRFFGLSPSGLLSPEFATTPDWSWAKFIDLLKHLWLPVIVLGVGGVAGMMRVMRANLLDEMRRPYVMTARAKGVRPLKLLLKYPLRVALNPVVSGLGTLFPQLVSGGAIVALVLSLPMAGPVMFNALLAQDVYLAGSMLMLLSVLGVLGTLVSDLLLLWIDPRIRFEGGGK